MQNFTLLALYRYFPHDISVCAPFTVYVGFYCIEKKDYHGAENKPNALLKTPCSGFTQIVDKSKFGFQVFFFRKAKCSI